MSIGVSELCFSVLRTLAGIAAPGCGPQARSALLLALSRTAPGTHRRSLRLAGLGVCQRTCDLFLPRTPRTGYHRLFSRSSSAVRRLAQWTILWRHALIHPPFEDAQVARRTTADRRACFLIQAGHRFSRRAS